MLVYTARKDMEIYSEQHDFDFSEGSLLPPMGLSVYWRRAREV